MGEHSRVPREKRLVSFKDVTLLEDDDWPWNIEKQQRYWSMHVAMREEEVAGEKE